MKKFLFITLFIGALTLSGCQNNEKQDIDKGEVEEKATSSSQINLKIVDSSNSQDTNSSSTEASSNIQEAGENVQQ